MVHEITIAVETTLKEERAVRLHELKIAERSLDDEKELALLREHNQHQQMTLKEQHSQLQAASASSNHRLALVLSAVLMLVILAVGTFCVWCGEPEMLAYILSVIGVGVGAWKHGESSAQKKALMAR